MLACPRCGVRGGGWGVRGAGVAVAHRSCHSPSHAREVFLWIQCWMGGLVAQRHMLYTQHRRAPHDTWYSNFWHLVFGICMGTAVVWGILMLMLLFHRSIPWI